MHHDVIILGAGPAGLYAGYLAGLRQMKAIILDSLPEAGGQLTSFYPDKPIYDIPGFPQILARDFIRQLQNQWQPYQEEVPLVLGQKIVKLDAQEKGYQLSASTGQFWQGRFVILASGPGTLTPRPLTLPHQGMEAHIHYAIANHHQFQNKRVLILGGGDSALDWATILLPLARQVTVVHRRKEFRAVNGTLVRFQTQGTLLGGYDVVQLQKTADGITVTIKDLDTQNIRSLEIDEIVVCYGFIASPALYQSWGLHSTHEGIAVNGNLETNLKDIFVVGNAAHYEGKTKNIASALGEVANAIDTIHQRLFPGKTMLYSSMMKR